MFAGPILYGFWKKLTENLSNIYQECSDKSGFGGTDQIYDFFFFRTFLSSIFLMTPIDSTNHKYRS